MSHAVTQGTRTILNISPSTKSATADKFHKKAQEVVPNNVEITVTK